VTVPRSVVVEVVALDVVVGVVDVVVDVVVGVVVEDVVVVEVEVVWVVVDEVVVLDVDELVVESSSPAATTASATPRPITAAIRIAISALAPPLIPWRGGSP